MMEKLIHQYFDGATSPGCSRLFFALAGTWKCKHPAWRYQAWSRDELRERVSRGFPGLADTASDRLLADVGRYFILYEEGGLYADWDFECIEPFDTLAEGAGVVLFADPNAPRGTQRLSGSLMLAAKGHPFLRSVLSLFGERPDLMESGDLVNEAYVRYGDKADISICAGRTGMACTRDEMKLYGRRLLKDGDIQEKIQEARSICYYKRDRTPAGKPVDESRTDILYVSTSVECVGGAFSAGYRIHRGLREIGFSSKLLALRSGMSAEENRKNGVYLAARKQGERCGYASDMEPLRAYPGYALSSHGFSPAVTGVDIVKNIEAFDPKLVILHGINGGFATIEDLGRIRRKVVWRLPDCWAFTGGCYYFADCRRYLTGCGKCPKLGSDTLNDLSREVWRRKAEAWSQMDLTVVAPTQWMKRVAEESVLLRGREVHVIPNGLDLAQHYPVDKQLARKALRIPEGRKVILFGAINAFDPRKGLRCLVDALRMLSVKHREEYALVVFGMGKRDLGIDIPARFLGYLADQYVLQLAYSAADVMAVPSLEEAFGQTVTEAMACATPVVAFRETGPESIIEHKVTGYLANYADAEDLAAGIEWILSSTERTERLSGNARRRMEMSYDIRIVARQYEQLFHRLTNP